MISLGRCCWAGRRVSQSPDWWSSFNAPGKMREGGDDDGKGMVSDVEGVQRLGGREIMSSMRGEIFVCVAVLVVVVLPIVPVGVVVLMVVVGVVVLIIVVKVLCIGVVEVVQV